MEAGHRDRPRPERDDRDESRGNRLARPRERADLSELDELTELDELAELEADGDSKAHGDSDLEADLLSDLDDGQSFRELRPQPRLRIWQIVPIVALGALGSLMFAFPLAFEFGGDGGPVVAMLGLLLSSCSAGWGIMAARRVGCTWPGLPARGSGRRPDWRVVAAYAAFAALIGVLAVVRVARLR
ncbi:MAG: hypothetical protein JO362_13820 [Streptomycetaceae bacterium]|nr:hypothetical protein [Streptomycetaceae bacterium]